MRQISRTIALGILSAAALASECGWGEAQAQVVLGVNARVVAKNIPGASAIAQVGAFVTGGTLTRATLRFAPIQVQFLASSPPTSNPAQCWTRRGSWLAACQISARRYPPAVG